MPPKSVKFPVKTLTPIWTGDSDIKTTYLRATSFVGGLRFWAEAILRSFGYYDVCNINSSDSVDINKRCPEKRGEKEIICSACQVFGCTGHAKSFAMKVVDESLECQNIPRIQLDEREYTNHGNREIPSYLDGRGGLQGEFSLFLSPFRPVAVDPLVFASLIIQLNWGSIGARDQYGHGFAKTHSGFNANFCGRIIANISGKKVSERSSDAANSGDLADLKDFFFFKSQADQADDCSSTRLAYNKIPFIIRHDTRNRLRPVVIKNGQALRHYFHGNVRGIKQGTKFNIGIYNSTTLVGWGWFPKCGEFSFQRDLALNALKDELMAHSQAGTLKWKEFDSDRDNCRSSNNWPDFFADLLRTSWR